jgi:hypothetical protein
VAVRERAFLMGVRPIRGKCGEFGESFKGLMNFYPHGFFQQADKII